MTDFVNELREQLSQLDSEEKLRDILSELNFEYADEPIPNDFPESVQPHVQDIRIIAKRNNFNIIFCKINRLLKGIERPIGDQIVTRYFHSLIIFTDPKEQEFHFTNIKLEEPKKELEQQLKEVGIRRRPFRRIIVGQSERLRTAAERLAMIQIKDSPSALEIHRRINRAFDVQEVSRDFYQDFVRYYKFFREHLSDKNKLSQSESDTFTQTIFNRLFFLYFLQKKGYLDSDRFYFVHKINSVGDRNYYSEVLIPLFKKLSIYEYKNPDVEHIPFLNGGLFEFEDEEEKLRVENSVLTEVINHLFERYNFTVREDTEWEQEVAIDPEMLGTIFERLILGLESKAYEDIPDPRRATGSYYTPKFIVSFISNQAILNYLIDKLKEKFPRAYLKNLVFKHDITPFEINDLKSIKNCLLNIKVVDPGVGSGAFPVDVLLKMVELTELMDKQIEPAEVGYKDYRYNLKRQIIENNIYGVDIQKRAVDLAHLRLWLSIIVDLNVEDIQEIPPLPNLDFNIFVGESLVSRIGEYDFDLERELKLDQKGLDLIEEYRKLKVAFQDLKFRDEKEIYKGKIAGKKRQILEWFFSKKLSENKRQLSRIERQTSLDYGLPSTELPFKKKAEEEIARAEAHLKRIDELVQNFNWGLDFFDILEINGGFDAVIGNPPYGIKVPKEVQREFGLGSRDSYGVFTALGIKILRPGGTLFYIMSDTWQTIRTHKLLRDSLLYQTDAQYITFVPNDTFAATVNPGVYSFIKRWKPDKKGGDNRILAADFSPLKIRQPDGRMDPANLEAAFELLIEIDRFDESKDGYTIYSDREMAIFAYRQKLITRFSNHSFFIASPKLFGLMRDVGNMKNEMRGEDEIPVYSVEFNGKELSFFKLGDISEIKQGLETADNMFYLRKEKDSRGSYKIIDKTKVLKNEEVRKLSDDEKRYGIKKGKYNGRHFIPIDKGGESDTDEAWLPQYLVKTDYYIDWSEESLKRMKTLTIAQRDKMYGKEKENSNPKHKKQLAAVIRNQDYYFTQGLTFSRTGFYSPSFRIGSKSVFSADGATLFTKIDAYSICGILNSKFLKFLYKNFIGHTVHTQVEELKQVFIIDSDLNEINSYVESIIRKQESSKKYDYMTNEQIEIDRLVYQMYNLSEEDIQEVENWYFRRYPKLARVIEKKLEEKRQG